MMTNLENDNFGAIGTLRVCKAKKNNWQAPISCLVHSFLISPPTQHMRLCMRGFPFKLNCGGPLVLVDN